MSNLAQYSKIACYVTPPGGALTCLTQESDVSIQRMSGAQEVNTVHLGFAGMSPGSPKQKVAITNAVPQTDFELDVGTMIRDQTVCEFSFFMASHTMTVKGFFTDDDATHAVDTASKLKWNAVTEFGVWV